VLSIERCIVVVAIELQDDIDRHGYLVDSCEGLQNKSYLCKKYVKDKRFGGDFVYGLSMKILMLSLVTVVLGKTVKMLGSGKDRRIG